MGIRVWGNYCGPGWTGGSNVGPGVRGNFSVITTDALDAQCRLHDLAYADAEDALAAGDIAAYRSQTKVADQNLVSAMTTLMATLDAANGTYKTSDGKTLLDSNVQNLVQAMASFSPPAMGQTTLPPAYASQLNSMIAANWQ